MAIYHLAVQILGRGEGRRNLDGSRRKRADNAVAAAAYRAGEKLRDGQSGHIHDYSRRAGVAHREIIVPDDGPIWLADRERLWNEVERLEGRRDSQLARELNIALPHELDAKARRELVQGFVREQFVSRGMVADFALHDPVPERGDDPRNFHAHILLPLRRVRPDGLDQVKTRAWNSRALIGEWRKAWAVHVNRALAETGRKVRVDHRSLAEQREEAVRRGDRKEAVLLDRAPEIHVGPRARAMQARDVEPVSRTRRTGGGRAAGQGTSAPPRSQPYPDPEASRRDDGGREAFTGERIRRARETWESRRAYRERSGSPERLRSGRPSGAARVRDYPRTDQGPRVGWLWSILAGNNAKLKADIARIDARSARFDRWIDYYDRKITWWVEGQIGGAAFRRERWLKAQAAREAKAEAERKIAHARKRAAQLRALTTELRQIVALLAGRQEAGLRRARQIAAWGRVAAREAGRALTPQRGRERQAPNGRTDPSSGAGGGSSPFP